MACKNKKKKILIAIALNRKGIIITKEILIKLTPKNLEAL
jgi:hypothetical protein